jgi:hypothetical protein
MDGGFLGGQSGPGDLGRFLNRSFFGIVGESNARTIALRCRGSRPPVGSAAHRSTRDIEKLK